jgi:hypothetical protein
MTEKKMELELGDFILLDAPTNPEWHTHIFFISYIDKDMVEVIDIQSSFSFVWNWMDASLQDIKKISVIERSSLKGYAKQNGLYPHIWVDIYFGGETPKSITAEITNVEEDMIELTTYPENKVLYIDFAYQGVPRNLPIDKICIREKPASFRRGVFSEEDEDEDEDEEKREGEEGSMEYLENGYIQIVLPNQFKADENFHDHLQKIYALGDGEEEEEELEEIVQTLEIPPEQQHFGLEAQVNDLLDAFLSNIPDYKRTPSVMNRIYTHIQRFKELREDFSTFDSTYHQIIGVKRPLEKPIVNKIANLDISLPWILPVVSQIKKIYYDNDEKDGGPHLSREDEAKEPELNQINLETEFEDETKVENDTFYQNDIPQSTVKYANMYIQTANYESTFETYPEIALHTSPVKTDMDVLLSLNNKTIGFEGIYKKRFTIQRYNTEVKYVKSRGKENASFATLFPGDSLSFQSLFLLPSVFLSFSKIKTPNTSIFSKSSLNHVYPSYFQYLQQKTHVVENEIVLDEDFTPELKDTFQYSYLSPNDETVASMDPIDKLKSLLQHAIPSYESYLLKQKKVYTFVQAVDVLEPFYVYMEDIPWKMANNIKNLLYRNIDKYNAQTALKAELFKTLLLETYKNASESHVNRLFEDTSDKKKIGELYEVVLGEFSSSEWLKYILEYDQARLFGHYIKEQNLELYVPDFLLPDIPLEEEENDSKKCWKRVIAKKYVNFNDLKEDNKTSAIFFDKEYDTTDYSLVSTYKKQNPDITEEEFVDYWSQTLSAKYGYTLEHAIVEAGVLWKGEKQITDGDYAILEQTPNLPKDLDNMPEDEQENIALESNVKKRVMYFIRKKNKWEHETDLDEYSFIESSDLLCNIDPKCMTSGQGQCVSETELLHKFKNMDREKIRKEFEGRYELSKEEFSQKYEKEGERYLEWMEKEAKIRKEIRLFYDHQAYEYGKRAVLQEVLFSPFLTLRDSVLQKSLDFITKQNYIVLFVEKFCREPIVEEPLRESEHWKYCKETNTKLMPTSLYRLAKAYIEDVPFSNSVPVKYNAVLNNLCNTIGKLSDDGDAYIDKHSGYILRKVEMREEGFEIGLDGEDNMDMGLEDYDPNVRLQMGSVVQTVKMYTNEVDQRLYNMISTICRNIYVYGEENKENMMHLCMQWLKIPSFFPSEGTYKIGVDKIMKKRESDPKIKIPDSYAVYIKKKHVLIAALSVLVVVQTAIPEIPIDRTFPGCVKSFDGYPLKDGQDDLSSIAYIACVLKKIYHSKEDAALLPKGKGELENVLLKTLKDVVLLQSSVVNMYDLKRIYLLENPMNIIIPRELEIEQKWAHFLPPISPFKIPPELLKAISGNNPLDIFQVKARVCSLAVVQYIREMIASKNILFQTKSGFPFLQNACCDEVLQFPPKSFLHYFFEDAAIEKMVEILNEISLHIERIKHTYKARTLLKERLGGSEPELENDASGKTPRNIYHSLEPLLYYATLIHYCRLDHEIYPIPPELERFCGKKPGEMSQDVYDPKSSLLEKMHFLQKHQVEMDARKMVDFMNIVNQRNPVTIVASIVVSHTQIMESSLASFWEMNQDIPTLDPYRTMEMNTANLEMKTRILSFIRRNASVKMTDVELDVATKPFYFYNPEMSKENLASHVKSLVYRFGVLYPCFLLKTSVRKKTPKYWELLPEDSYYLSTHTQIYRELLEPFVKDTLLLPIFRNCVETRRILSMLDYTEYMLISENVYETAMFVLHSIFTVWIGLVDHPEIYNTVTRVVRENNELERREATNSQLEIDEIEEVDIAAIPMEQRDEIHQRLADLFLVMFSTLKTKKQVNAKEAIMMTYADIMREVDFSKDREKQRLKTRFKQMGTDERKAENMLKKLHLGDFAVDMKKINQYGKTDLLGDRDEEDGEADLAIAMDIAEQENEEFMVTETRNGDSNLEDQGGEEDYADMNENAYENYEPGENDD